MTKLRKDFTAQLIPGKPGVPGVAGAPATPGYWSEEIKWVDKAVVIVTHPKPGPTPQELAKLGEKDQQGRSIRLATYMEACDCIPSLRYIRQQKWDGKDPGDARYIVECQKIIKENSINETTGEKIPLGKPIGFDPSFTVPTPYVATWQMFGGLGLYYFKGYSAGNYPTMTWETHLL